MARNGESASVNICVFCGTQTPEMLTRDCAHGKTARVRGDAARAAARLWLVLQSVESHRADLHNELERAEKAGLATSDSCPPVRPHGNVVFLQDREIVGCDQLRPVRLA